jgi:glycosyltransferase involved in cell wall biosynthesis
MGKPRVLFVAGTAEYGSGECLLVDYLLTPNEKKISPIVAFPGQGLLEQKLREAGLETVIIPGKDWLTDLHLLWKQPFLWLCNLKSFIEMSGIIQKKEIKLVASFSFINWTGALSARQEGIPHIWLIREVMTRKKNRLIFFWGKWLASRLANDLSTNVLLESALAATLFSRKRMRKKARILPPAIDAEEFLSKLDEFAEQSKATEPEIGLFINDPDPKKTIKILSQIYRARENLSLKKLFLFFPGLEKKRIERIKTKILRERCFEELSLEFPSFYSRPSIGRELRAAIIVPGIDPLSRLVLEAGLAALPVFVEESASSELIIPGETGFVFKDDDYQTLVEVLVEVLKNKDFSQSIGKSAREHIIQNYHLKTWQERFEQIIEESLFLPQR